jgi:hypothetical protein
LQLFAEQTAIVDATPLLDTDAELSVLDGGVAVHAGWSMAEVAQHALEVRPIYGLARPGPHVDGYMHEVTCYVPAGSRFAELRFRVLITPPNTLAFAVLGRAGFFEQVDVTFAELEKMLYLRFRNPALSRLFG